MKSGRVLQRTGWSAAFRALVGLGLLLLTGTALARDAAAEALAGRHQALQAALAASPLGLPLLDVLLPADGSIAFIGGADFGNAFDSRRPADLNHFYHSWANPEPRFLDQALEEKRMELFVAVAQFLDTVRLHATPDPASVQSVVTVNADRDADLQERIREGVRQLNGAAKAVVTIHQEIVLLGRMQVP